MKEFTTNNFQSSNKQDLLIICINLFASQFDLQSVTLMLAIQAVITKCNVV
jgi:hypothetical protein